MLMTPGPTAVPQQTREAMARRMTHPFDQEFGAFYRELTTKLGRVFGTDDDLVILGGEASLGLEATLGSLVDPGDAVLCLSNGVYGDSFARRVELVGAEPVVVRSPPTEPISFDAVEDELADRTYAAATLVHCETPTGVLNEVEPILARLREEDIVTIVDAVSTLGGAPVPIDTIDVCIGASPKCLSAPPGATPISVSGQAWEAVDQTEPRSLYAGLQRWRDRWLDEGTFPHTPLVSNLFALDAAVDRILEEGIEAVIARHRQAAERCRARGREIGLSRFADEVTASPTVTAFRVDGAIDTQRRLAEEHDIVVATGLGERADDLLRVGHMGVAATVDKVDRTMDALASVLDDPD